MDAADEIRLPFPADPEPGAPDLPLIPVRMVNEFVYCPRLAYLEWVQKEWRDSSDTVEGRWQHRRVDRATGKLPSARELDEDEKIHARSVELGSERLGITAKLDLVEADGGLVRPVDYKRGKRPHVAAGAYDPERVQVCAQGLLLGEHGYRTDEGILYFAGSRERVRVVFDDELRQQTLTAIADLRTAASRGQIPPPLEDSPKCPRCSLVTICLPDETNLARLGTGEVRPLAVRDSASRPVYVQSNGAKIAKKGETLAITADDSPAQTARLGEISHVVVLGNVYVTTPTLHELLRRNIPISWHSWSGYFLGHTIGTGHGNVELRTAQYEGSFDGQVCLHLARGWVAAKIRNGRTLLRRNWRGERDPSRVLRDLTRLARQAERCRSIQSLLGVEGAAAAAYFGNFVQMVREDDELTFRFDGRNRRPPLDPVNAMLSFCYALLTRSCSVALTAVGFDSYRGFYHQPRYGRPALALDLMEPFRPLLCESTVLTLINNGEIRATDFIRAAGAVTLNADGRKRVIAAFERRLDQEAVHPVFGYRASYRRIVEIQARLLGRFLLGEIPSNPNYTTR